MARKLFFLMLAGLFALGLFKGPETALAQGLNNAIAGQEAAKQGNFNKAIELYTKAIDSGDLTGEGLAMVYNNRGIAWDYLRMYDKAIADYKKSIEINPGWPDVYYNLGLVWKARGDRDRAIENYSKAISRNPEFTWALIGRAGLWSEKQAFDRAIADYEKAIESRPNHPAAYNNLAWLLATCPQEKYRDGERAVDLAVRAYGLSQGEPHYLGTLAAAYARAGRFEKAVKTQEKAIKILKDKGREKSLAPYTERLESYLAKKPWTEKK